MHTRMDLSSDVNRSMHRNDTRARSNKSLAVWAVAVVVLAIPVVLAVPGMAGTSHIGMTSEDHGFNEAGNVLVSDQFNNRIVEIDPHTNTIVWSFGSNNPSLCNPGPGAIIGSNWAERLADGRTVIAGTGIPAGADPLMPNGCADNRVILVNHHGDILWQYGQAGVSGSGPNELNVPVSAIQLRNHDFLITDQGNNRIIEVNHAKKVVWSYGPATGPGALNSPNSAELLRNGHILIADEGNNRAIEITRSGKIVWEYHAGINAAAFASRLPNGHTLIVDSNDARIVEVTRNKQVVFEYFTNTSSDSNPMPLPTNAVRLRNGNTIVADEFNHRVFIFNHDKKVVWQYGMTNVPGNGSGHLNGPYTAFVIGDYTGQTVPPGSTSETTRTIESRLSTCP